MAVAVGVFVLAGCAPDTAPAPKPKLADLTGKTYREAWRIVEKTDGIVGAGAAQAEGADTSRLSVEERRNQDEWIVCTQEVVREGDGNGYRVDFVLSPTVAGCTADAPAPPPVGTPIKALTPPDSYTYGDLPSWAGAHKGMSESRVSGVLGVELNEVCQANTDTSYSADQYGLNCWISDQEYGTLVFRDGTGAKLYPLTHGLQAWLCCETGRPEQG
ncbi:hypothetical protein [Streptomyces sp. NBC_00893]|uniref:hypothetical protein n=1 Tax=Streptomyces sp. NBC_00893 TaxID=2975862 RepID=UPI00225409E2|nr:hypothetical protein [Streptomyces sp. NBC_00893]MCX4852131.1 hypothetical protein [Streptomyces sp. NBC_00893]